jgi:transcriptional antiterminator RfaH
VSVHTVNPRAKKVKPYFPGYLFVRLDANFLSKYTFRWMPHIVGLVSCGDEPTPVPDALVAAIRRRVAEFALVCADPAHGMKRGDAVRIQAGPFEGYEAVFDMRMSGNDRVKVLLELINGKSVALDIQATKVDRIPCRQVGR